MNREIKFRGYSIWDEKFVYGFLTKNLYEEQYLIDDYLVDMKSIGQYTGIKDKKRQPIFEGDILKLHDTSTFSNKTLVEVVYKDTAFVMFDGKYYEDFHSNKYLEVIGNIYKNNEILTV